MSEAWLWSQTSRDCWIWTGTVHRTGYGVASYQGKQWRVHRLAYVLTYGEPENDVLHRCGIRLCINPEHLYDGTDLENMADRDRHGRTARHLGIGNPMAKLTDEQVRLIRLETRPGRVAAGEYGLSISHFYRVKRREAWGHVTDLGDEAQPFEEMR